MPDACPHPAPPRSPPANRPTPPTPTSRRRAGIPATTRYGVMCDVNDRALQDSVISSHNFRWTIHRTARPQGSRTVIGYEQEEHGAHGWSVTAEAAGHPLKCAPAPDPKGTFN